MEIQDQHVINGLGALVATVLSWVGVRIHNKVDKLDDKLSEHSENHVKRDELASIKESFDRTAERIFTRLDEFADRLPRKDER